MLRNRNAPRANRHKCFIYNNLQPKKTKIFVYIGPQIADTLYMQNKYEIANDEYQFGDLVNLSQIQRGKEAWDYFWRDNDPYSDKEWVTGDSGRLSFSSKEAAKRGLSRLVKHYPPAWNNCDFIVAKVFVN